MKLKTILSIATVFLLLTSATAFAWPGKGGQNCGDCDRRGAGMNYEQQEQRMEDRHEKMAVILDLTEEQQEKLEALAKEHQEQRKELREKMQSSRDEMRAFRSQKGVDGNVDEYRAKARQNADLKADMMAQRIEHKKAVLALMTPEQQEKAQELWDMFQNKRGQKGHGKRDCGNNCDRPMKRCGKS